VGDSSRPRCTSFWSGYSNYPTAVQEAGISIFGCLQFCTSPSSCLLHNVLTKPRSRRQTKVFFVPFLSPDPSLQIPRDSNTATLRLYKVDDYSDWHLSIEYREKSVLGGISSMGGFWTVLNGLFATIFGTTLMFVLFGEWTCSSLLYSREVC